MHYSFSNYVNGNKAHTHTYIKSFHSKTLAVIYVSTLVSIHDSNNPVFLYSAFLCVVRGGITEGRQRKEYAKTDLD